MFHSLDMSEQFINLTWNQFQDTTVETFRSLGRTREFADVTLACGDGEQVEAHRVILSACSPVLRRLLLLHTHQHTLLYMRGMALADLNNLLKFMYFGEVMVETNSLENFLESANELQVVGLSKQASEETNGLDETYQGEIMQELETKDINTHESVVKTENKHEATENSNICDYENCRKKFSNKANMKTHIQAIHEDLRLYCTSCSFSTNHQSNLKRHMRSMHEETTENTNISDSNLQFPDEASDVTTDIDPEEETGEVSLEVEHECDHCGTKNKSGKALMKHRHEKHPGLNWLCRTCGKEFASHNNLKKHKGSLHQFVRFSCDMCQLQFKRKEGLNHHTKSKHSV